MESENEVEINDSPETMKMMHTDNPIRLTSTELSALWTAYMNNSMASCMLTYFMAKTEDTEVRSIVEFSLNISDTLLRKITHIYTEEGHPIPAAFDINEDVNTDALALYSDVFFLNYVHNMSRYGITTYGAAFSGSTRPDVLDFFSHALEQTRALYTASLNTLLEKGLYLKAAAIPIPDKVEFIHKQNFLNGWFGERRPLSATEIMHLYNNIQRNGIGKALLLGFAQTAGLQQVRDYMMRGAKIANKVVELTSHILSEENVTESATWDSEVLKSTTPPFSDKLMMFQVSLLTGISLGYYGAALGTVQRRDLASKFMRIMTEALQYAEDGANIMIEHGWLEQTPLTFDNYKMAKTKNPH